MVTLEYSWERSCDIKHGVRGMVRASASSYIVDCDSSIRILDIREKAATILCNSEPASVADHMSHIAIEPQNKDLFSACRDEIVRIFDWRNCSEPLWSFSGHDFSFAGWNENGREFSVMDNGNSSVFSVNTGIPTGRHKRSIPGSALPSLRGDIWCSWQRKNYIEHQLAAVWQKSHSLLLSPVVAIRPVSVVSIAIRSVEAIAVVSVPGISLSLRGSRSISSRLSISRPLSIVVSIAIRPISVVSIAIRSVEAIAIVSIPGISLG